MMFPGLHPAAMMSTVGLGNQQQYRGSGFSGASGPHGVNSRPPNPPQIPPETCYLYIPNAAVGAVIGINIVFLGGGGVEFSTGKKIQGKSEKKKWKKKKKGRRKGKNILTV